MYHPIRRTLKWLFPSAEVRELAVVMLLPIPSGVYAAFVLAGGLASIEGVVQVGLLVFGGSASAAIILSQFHEDRREELHGVGGIGLLLVPAAALTAIFAPTLQQVLHESLFTLVTVGVILLIAFEAECEYTASVIPRIERLGIGTLAIAIVSAIINVQHGIQVRVVVNRWLIFKSIAAAVVGLGFVTILILLRPQIQKRVEMAKFETGCAIALTFVALDLAGIVHGYTSIIALILTIVFSMKRC